MALNTGNMIERNKYIRQIIVYADYFKEFKNTLSRKTLERIPERYLQAITSVKGLYEIRIKEGGNIYRIFCCLDEGNLVILFNGF